MKVRFPPKVAMPSKKDLGFLRDLEKKLHCLSEHNYRGRKVYADRYSDERLSSREANRILSIVDASKGVVLFPFNTSMGFAVGYQVGHITPAPDLKEANASYKRILSFAERQLPSRNWGFDRMADVFMRKDNIDLIVSCGKDAPVRDYGRYDY